VPKIEVTFDVWQDGRIDVSVKDTGTGTQRSLTSLDRPESAEDIIRAGTEVVEQTAALWYE
jgi:molecular chaperone DnaK (HSP70)